MRDISKHITWPQIGAAPAYQLGAVKHAKVVGGGGCNTAETQCMKARIVKKERAIMDIDVA